MLRIRNKNQLQEFHMENLGMIEKIHKEHGVRNGRGGFFAKRRARHAIRMQVNVRAGRFGIAYDLRGRVMNFGMLNVDFLMAQPNPIITGEKIRA